MKQGKEHKSNRATIAEKIESALMLVVLIGLVFAALLLVLGTLISSIKLLACAAIIVLVSLFIEMVSLCVYAARCFWGRD